MSEIVDLASDVMSYKLKENEGFPFEKTDAVRYKNASVVIALGLAENVEELHEFLYPSEENEGVSDTVQQISDNISYLTGVVRPSSLDEENVDGEESTEGVPIITHSGNGTSETLSDEETLSEETIY